MTRLPLAQTAQHVGVVFQDFESQLFCSDVEREIAFALENRGLPREKMREVVEQWLENLGLSHLRRRDPVTLSGGEKQRLALAAAMAADPQVVVLDEPMTDLDPQGAEEVGAACQRLHEQGRTVLIVDHSSTRAAQADALMVLDDGRLAYDGKPQAVLSHPTRAQQLGLAALPTVQICDRLGLPARPMTVAAAVQELGRIGAQLDEDAWQSLQQEEARRTAQYG